MKPLSKEEIELACARRDKGLRLTGDDEELVLRLLATIEARDKRIKELEERCNSLEAINDKDRMEEPTL